MVEKVCSQIVQQRVLPLKKRMLRAHESSTALMHC